MHACVCVCIYVTVCVCVSLCVCMHMCTCMHVCGTHMHMHLHYSYNFIHVHACVYILTSMTCRHEKFKGEIFHGYIT